MDAQTQINLNSDYNVIVQKVQESFDSFAAKTAGGGTKYCHLCSLLLADGVTILQAQICTNNPKLPEFSVHDKIKIHFVNHVPSKSPPYTFKFMELIEKEAGLKKVHITGITTANPMVAGTARERALGHAVHLWQMKSHENEKVIETADLFFEFLTKPVAKYESET